MTICANGICQAVARFDCGAKDAGVGADGQGVIIFVKAAGKDLPCARAVTLGEWLCPPTWLAAGPIWYDPDLEQGGGFILQIIFCMADTVACAHDLDIASRRASFITQAVLVRDGASADICDDLHVGMWMWRKAGLRRNHVVIPDTYCTLIHPCSVVIIAE